MTKAANVRESAPKATTAPETPKPVTVAGITVVTDSNGRKIGLRKLTTVERFELDDVIEGKTLSSLMTIRIVASVVSIGDEGMTPITSREDLHERLAQLGDEGLLAITDDGMKLYGIDLSELEKKTAKNS